MERSWWKESTIYQIYPRSFKDGNGDGVGDLKGIVSKLDHLSDLGIDVVWLSPMFKSPNDDNGYDISDYYDIMDEFGNMADFDELLAGLKTRGIKLILDLVVNHSSDEHKWFEESRKSKDNPYRDYYIWRTGDNGQAPNDWVSFFGGSAWERDENSGEYYLHLFTRKQPDLNWENEKVRQEIYKLMRFWLDKGVDGFRMDVIPLISKKPGLPAFPAGFQGDYISEYANGPRVHEFIQEMYREVMAHYDMMTIGEGIGVTQEHAPDYVDPERKELNMIFHFDHMFMDRNQEDFFSLKKWGPADFKKVFRTWDETLDGKGWNSLYLGNHDFPRMASRFGRATRRNRVPSAKMLASVLFTLRGTPYIYQGDEIGMTNTPFDSIDEFRDVNTHNMYKIHMEQGGDPEDFLNIQQHTSRDHARTPIQWDSSEYAGFSEVAPWLKVNPNYTEINVEEDRNNPDSVLNYYKQLIRLRKENLTLVYGSYEEILPDHPYLYSYYRKWEEDTIFVIHNYYENGAEVVFPDPVDSLELLISNYPQDLESTKSIKLRPYESRVYRKKN